MDEKWTIRLASFMLGALITLLLIPGSCKKSLISFEGSTTDQDRSSNTVDTLDHRKDSSTIRDTTSSTEKDTVVRTKYITKTKVEHDTVVKYKRPDKEYHTVNTSYDRDRIELDVSTDLKGEFVDQSIDYKLDLKDSLITRDSTTTIKDSTRFTEKVHTQKTIKEDKWELGAGANIQGSRNSFDVGPHASIEKDGVQIGYGYNVIRGEHRITLQKKFDLISQ